MVEAAAARWAAVSAWAGVARPGRFGASGDPPGVSITPLAAMPLATIVARTGREADVDERIRASFGIELPSPGRAHFGRIADLVWSAPRQWLLVGHGPVSVLEVSSTLASLASVTDQSDARALLQIGGARCREVLAKGFSVDLHARAFAPGSAASTSVAHVSVQIWRRGGTPTFVVAVPRSFAGSFWWWASAAAAEYGYEVTKEREHP